MKPYFFDLSRDDLRQLLTQWGLQGFRAQQVLEWVYAKGVIDPAAMTNLAAADRRLLAEKLSFTSGKVAGDQLASDGTRKLLITWDQRVLRTGGGGGSQTAAPEGKGVALPQLGEGTRQTECVMIPADDGERSRRTACVSSQVGCPVGCRFCASGLGGLDGNLTAGQIVEQVWRLGQGTPADDGEPIGPVDRQRHRISHVVFMGMGEPLANFDNVVSAIHTLMAPWALGISGRRITVSTVGLPAQIRRLAAADLPVTLAISLHAPNDALRREIIPWAEFVTVEQLLEAGRQYFDRTGREVTLEYILLAGVNDQPIHARELAEIAATLRSNVNLIRYNEVSPLPFKRPPDADVTRFCGILRRAGINTHIRASRGRDIAAACGQLRHETRLQAAG